MALRPYEQQVRRQGIDGTRQQGANAGFGEGIGEAISGLGSRLGQYAAEKNRYEERFDQAAAMEQDTAFGEQVRDLENDFLRSQGRGTIDSADQTQSEWDRFASEAMSRANGDRQREALRVLIDRRRDRFLTQSDAHLTRQTETYVVGQENAHVATLSRDVAMFPVGSSERNDGYVQLGQALDEVAARRGFSREARVQLGFETFSGVHIATAQSLVDADPETAKAYLEEHRDQIDPTAYARLFPQVRDEANNRFAAESVRGELMSSPPDEAEVDGERSVVMSPIPPGTRISSGFGPRTSPGGVGSSNHRGIDWAVPVNSPVVAALPGVVSIKSDPEGYGTYIEIDHGGGQVTRYAHLSSATVQDGQRVGAGERIALSGGARGAEGAGNSQGPHLHFEYLLNGEAKDPSSVIGQERATSERTLSAPSFRTVEDVYAFAERVAPNDWRRRDAVVQQGLQALQRDRAQRDDGEDQARRSLDSWLTSNPSATWDQIPANLRNAVSPSYQLSVRNSRTPSPTEGSEGGNTVFNALMDEAAAYPEVFSGRDMTAYSGILSQSQINTLLSHRRRILTNAPQGARGADALIRGVNSVVNGYVTEAFGRTPRGRTRTPAEEAQIAGVRESLYSWAEAFIQRERREPTQAEIIGELRVFLAPSAERGTTGGDEGPVPYGSVVGRNYGFIIPRATRGTITSQLTSYLRRAPTEQEISNEYARRLRLGQVELGSNLY